MGELRRMLSLLRQSGMDSGSDSSTALTGLHRIDELIEGASNAGIVVRLSVSGEVGKLDPSVDLAAYRVVQEALTNVARHVGPGATADVSIKWDKTGVSLCIEDDGSGHPVGSARDLSTGNGLIGLHERVAVAGGALEFGPKNPKGFALRARLPLGGLLTLGGVQGDDPQPVSSPVDRPSQTTPGSRSSARIQSQRSTRGSGQD